LDFPEDSSNIKYRTESKKNKKNKSKYDFFFALKSNTENTINHWVLLSGNVRKALFYWESAVSLNPQT